MQDTIEIKKKELDNQFITFSNELGKLEGQKTVLKEQLNNASQKIIELQTIKDIDEKAIEVLNLVQRSTRDKIKDAFEQMVTFALQSIYQQDYKFQLEFTTRGNLGEMNFKLKAPGQEEYRDLKDATAGGSFDIISLALRFVLLQVIRPKIKGFICLDEPTKMISSNLRLNEYNFYKTMSEKLNRQLIIVTHSDALIEQAETKIKIET